MMRLLVIALLATLSAPAAAQEVDADRYWLEAGIYFPAIDTSARVQGPGLGPSASTIDFERDLDFRSRAVVPSLAAGMRLGTDWRLVGEFYRLSRSRQATLESAIVFDGVTYPASGQIEGSFNSDVYRLSVGYNFVNRPEIEVGASLGAHVTGFSVTLAGSGSVGTAAASFQERRRRLLAPLPTAGLYLDWRPAPRVPLASRVDYLSLKVDDYNGRLINAQASAAHEVARGLDLGVMWRYVNYRLGVSRDDWSGQVSYRFSGPMAFVTYRFGS